MALRAKLNELLGERETGVLMDCVPPVDYEQLAKRTDLETQPLVLSADITTLRAEMTAEFANVRGEMATEFAAVHARFAEMDLKMATQMRATMVTHIGSMIGLAAFMAAIT